MGDSERKADPKLTRRRWIEGASRDEKTAEALWQLSHLAGEDGDRARSILQEGYWDAARYEAAYIEAVELAAKHPGAVDWAVQRALTMHLDEVGLPEKRSEFLYNVLATYFEDDDKPVGARGRDKLAEKAGGVFVPRREQ